MGYILDAAVLAGFVGAYRVYTDTRRSVLHNGWDAYKHLSINMSRHGADFLASKCIDVMCKNPSAVDGFISASRPYMQWYPTSLEQFRCGLLTRAARYRVWTEFEHLGYLQRVFRVKSLPFSSLFDAKYSWQKNLVYTSPTVLSYVKDESTRGYLHALSAVCDSYVGVFEGSCADIDAFLALLKDRKKDIVQDIRKGHILDRFPESMVGIIHPLRMEIESFLLPVPDPERSLCVETALAAQKPLQALFPLLECIVDYSPSATQTYQDVPIIAPLLFAGDRPVGILSGTNTYIMDPLLWSEFQLESFNQTGETKTLAETLSVKIVGHHGDAPIIQLI